MVEVYCNYCGNKMQPKSEDDIEDKRIYLFKCRFCGKII